MAVKMKRETPHNSFSEDLHLIPSPGQHAETSRSPAGRQQQQQQLQQYQQYHSQQRKLLKSPSDSCSFSSLRSFEDSILLREKGTSEGGGVPSGSLGNSFCAISGGTEGERISGLGSGGIFSRTPQKPVTGDEVQCGVCGRILCNKYVLKVHMRDVHTPRSMHQCPLCGRCYSTINSLRVHISTIHK